MSYGRTNLNQRLNKPLSVFKKSSALNVAVSGNVAGVDITPDGKTIAFTNPSGTSAARTCVMRGSGTPYAYSTQQFLLGHSTGQSTRITISDDSRYVVGAYPNALANGNGITGYFSGETLNAFSIHASIPKSTQSVSLSSDGQYLAASSASLIWIYKLAADGSNSWASPRIQAISGIGGISRFFGANDDLFVASNEKFTIFKRSGDTFTEHTSYEHGMVGIAAGSGISADGKICVAMANTSPFIVFAEYDGNTLRESKITMDFELLNSGCGALSDDGNYLAVPISTAPYLIIAQRQGSMFKKLPDPDVMPPTQPQGCAFTENGERLLVSGSNFVTLYER